MTSSALYLTLGCVVGVLVAASGCDAQPALIAPPTKPFLVVANQRSGVATLVEVTSGRVSHVDLDARPHEVAISPDARVAALTIPSETFPFRNGRRVVVLDLAAAKIARTIDIPDDPAGIGVSADGKELFATVWRQGTGGGIAIFDLDKGVVAAKLPATQPRRITVTADETLVVVTDRDDLRIIDRASREMKSVALGRNAGGSGVTCAPDSTRCYVALSQAGEIVEVDIRATRVLRRFAAQRGVDGIAYVAR